MSDEKPPTLEHVPTVEELRVQGLAVIAERGKRGTFYRILPEGQKLILDAMKRNGLALKAWHERNRTPAALSIVAQHQHVADELETALSEEDLWWQRKAAEVDSL